MPTTAPRTAETGAARWPELLRQHQAGEFLGFSERQIKAWNTQKVIPEPVLVGKAKYYRLRELTDWVNAGCPDRSVWRWKATFIVKSEDLIAVLNRDITRKTELLKGAVAALERGEKLIEARREVLT